MKPIEWCRARLLVPGNPLVASLPFAPADRRDAILALRAVITEIAAVADEVSDPEVARHKLEWWQGALRESAPHPALQALAASDAGAGLPATAFDPLIAGVATTLDNPRFDDRAGAWRHCLEIGGAAARLEARLLSADEATAGHLAELGAFGYLVRLVRDLGGDARAGRWPVPLDLQAEFQVARRDVVDGEAGRGFGAMVRAWLGDGAGRAEHARGRLTNAQAWNHRHVLIQHALDRRLAGRLTRRPRRLLGRRITPGGLGNAWCAWRQARRLRRSLVADD